MCADFTRLPGQYEALQRAGVTRLHLDFADGSFVPNILIGTEVFQLLPERSRFFREAHLMLKGPERLLHLFALHCDQIIFHVEGCENPAVCINRIRSLGARPGIAINPSTSLETISNLLALVDSVLVMTVNPGFAGSPFQASAIPKVAQLRRALSERCLVPEIIVDGGVNRQTIPLLRDAGAQIFVGGSTGLFGPGDLEANANDLLSLIRQ
jgi:ribulose-phosphate 3-epimerase